MNIIVATSIQADSGYEEKLLAKLLVHELKKLNYKVDYCFLPYHRDMIALPEQVVAYQMMKGLDCDLLITIGYPAIYLNHHNKVSYLFQLAPMIYEYYDTEFGVLANTQYENIRNSMLNADRIVFNESKKIYVNSKALQDQIKEYYDIKSDIFYLPCLLEEDDFNTVRLKSEYISAETDLLPESRYEILLDIISNNDNLSLLLSVPRTSRFHQEVLEKRIAKYDIESRVEVIYKPLSKNILENAKCYVSANYQKRKISNSLVRATEIGLPIIVANDSLAELEIANEFISEPDVSSYSDLIKSISSKSSSKSFGDSINKLAGSMVSR